MSTRDIYDDGFDEDVQQNEHNTCPECRGRVTTTVRETVCDDCGLVLDDRPVDLGPEWRSFPDQEDRERPAARPPAPVHGLAYPVDQQRPVGQAGQRVVDGLELQLMLDLLAFGDVGHGAGHADSPAAVVAHHEPAHQEPQDAACGVAHPHLVLQMARKAVQMGLDSGLQQRQVVRHHGVEPGLRNRLDRLFVQTQHLQPARREIDRSGFQVPVPKPVIGAARRQGVALFGLAQLPLGLLAIGYVGLAADDARDLPAGIVDPAGVVVYRRVFRHYVVWTGWSVLGLSLLARDFTDLVSTKSAYLEADVLVLPIALGFMAYGIYYIIVNVLFAGGRTSAIAGIVFGAALLNALLNVLLIPVVGALGAALSTTGAYFALVGMAAYTARRHVRVQYAWGRLGLVITLVLVLFAAAQPTTAWSLLPRLGARVGLIIAYLPLLLVVRLYTVADLREARRWLLDRRRSDS